MGVNDAFQSGSRSTALESMLPLPKRVEGRTQRVALFWGSSDVKEALSHPRSWIHGSDKDRKLQKTRCLASWRLARPSSSPSNAPTRSQAGAIDILPTPASRDPGYFSWYGLQNVHARARPSKRRMWTPPSWERGRWPRSKTASASRVVHAP